MADKPTIGTCLRLRRESHGLAQKELAAASDVSSSFVYMIEHDRHHNTQRLERVANRLGTSLVTAFALPDQPGSSSSAPSAGHYAARHEDDARFCRTYLALPPKQRRTMQRMLASLCQEHG